MANRAMRSAARRAKKWQKTGREDLEFGVAFTTVLVCLLLAAVALPMFWYLGRWLSRRASAERTA